MYKDDDEGDVNIDGQRERSDQHIYETEARQENMCGGGG